MIEYTLKIGDVMISTGNVRYTCFGLGSCIGLFLQDRVTGLSGGAHILLPENERGPDDFKFYSATAAIDEILQQFQKQGSDLRTLRAKITGGANVINAIVNTGVRNSESVIQTLVERKIFIAAVDIGGKHSRTANFESETGVLTVRSGGVKEFRTY